MKSHPKTVFIATLGKNLKVNTRGNGTIPLLVMGPATLFFNNPILIPESMGDLFTIYFVDLFSGQKCPTIDYNKLELNQFIDIMKNLQDQLALDKVALFAHSALGVLGIEYAKAHAERVNLLLLIGSSPLWTADKKTLSHHFFIDNASLARQTMHDYEQERHNKLSTSQPFDKQEKFTQHYSSRQFHFFKNPSLVAIDKLWQGMTLDMELTEHYFSLLNNYQAQKESFPQAPTFIALGIQDYSAPFLFWTDKTEIVKLPTVDYYVFPNSAHYPMVEDKDSFSEELISFMKKFDLIGTKISPRPS